jgi:putative transposase
MARAPRVDVGEHVYHVLNRSNGKVRIFHDDADYKDFEYLLDEMRETYDMRILAYILMPNHWHLLLFPKQDGDIGKSMHWLTTSHVRRHHSRKGTIGHGHIYQGTYKSFLVQTDAHLLTVLKYIERNAVRAKLSKTAEDWRWGSCYRRIRGDLKSRKLLADSPVPLPRNYKNWINDPEPAELLADVRQSVGKGTSYGVVDAPKY